MESSKATRVSPNGKQRLLSFLRGLLDDPTKTDIIFWVDKEEQVFRLKDLKRVASMWGAATGNPTMTYDKMSRGLRYFYENQTLEKMPGKDGRYKFLEPKKAAPMPLFNVASFLQPTDDTGSNSLPTSPTSSSSGSTTASPPQRPPAPIAPMANLLAPMDLWNQLMTTAQYLLPEFEKFKAENPILQRLPEKDQMQVYLNFRVQYPVFFPPFPN